MKKLIIIPILIILTACIPKQNDDIEQEYGVLNQTFSQLEPTKLLYRYVTIPFRDSGYSESQKQFIDNYLSLRNIDTTSFNTYHSKLVFIEDSFREIRYPEYGKKSKKKVNVNKFNSNSKTIILLDTDTLFEGRMKYWTKIELSRVLFNKQHTKAIYDIFATNYLHKTFNRRRIYANYKNGAWYIYKTEDYENHK